MATMLRIVVIGGGKHQFPGIKKLKEMGHHVTVFDQHTYPPTQAIADAMVLIDIKNSEAIIAHLKHQLDPVNHCMSFATEAALHTVVAVKEAFGIPGGITRHEVDFSSNKSLQRGIQRDAGLPCPGYFMVSKIEEIDTLLRQQNVHYPFIIKPLDGAGSRGVFFVQDAHELASCFPKTVASTRAEHVLVEEFINGIEFTLEAVINGSEITVVAISEKKKPLNNFTVSTELFYNSPLVNKLRESIERQVTRFLKQAGLQNTVIHLELIYTHENNQIYILESSARSGGFGIFDTVIPLASGLDFMKLFIQMETGNQLPPFSPEHNPVILRFFTANSGIFEGYFLIDEDLKVPGTMVVVFKENIGQSYSVTDDDTRSSLGYLISYGKEYEKVFAQANLIENNHRFLIVRQSKETT